MQLRRRVSQFDCLFESLSPFSRFFLFDRLFDERNTLNKVEKSWQLFLSRLKRYIDVMQVFRNRKTSVKHKGYRYQILLSNILRSSTTLHVVGHLTRDLDTSGKFTALENLGIRGQLRV